MDLALNNLQRLIWHKTNPTNNQATNVIYLSTLENSKNYPDKMLKF